MLINRRQFTAGAASTLGLRAFAQTPNALAKWKGKLKIAPATPENDRHSIHSYFNVSPESPDGKLLLYYSSSAANGESGEIRILNRRSGEVKVIASNITTEDAHRVACQQWVANGKKIVFHDFREGTTAVVCIDLRTGEEKILAKDRLVWWGAASGVLVPLYGKQWNPGKYPDLQFANVETGEITTILKAADVRAQYPEQVKKEFGDKPISICFPAMSPDGSRVFFKLAVAEINPDGNFRSPSNSYRETIVCYDVRAKKFLFIGPRWGHPAWLADSRRIINYGPVLTDSNTGIDRKIPGVPSFPGSHPSVSPDQKLFVTDVDLSKQEKVPGLWGVAVGLLEGDDSTIIHRFDNGHGATTWRHNHPHPVASPDSQRIYFNVNAGPWTRLFVAQL
jgi:Tol biopolymer transport system component